MFNKIITISIIALIIGMAFGYLKSQSKLPSSISLNSVNSLEEVSGTLYFNRSPESSLQSDILTLKINSFDVDNLVVNENIKFSPQLSPDRKYIAYSASPVDYSATFGFPYTKKLQIYLLNVEDRSIEMVSNSEDSFMKARPRWSPNGRYILYQGYSVEDYNNNRSPAEPDNWIVYLYDSVTKVTERVAFGAEAEWIPDGESFYYLQNSGLYLMRLDTFSYVKILDPINPDGIPNINSGVTFTLSQNGKKMALANSKSGSITIFDTNSDYRKEPNFVHEIKLGEGVLVKNPVFSPDGMYLALQEGEISNSYSKDGLKKQFLKNELLDFPIYSLASHKFNAYEMESYKSKELLDLMGNDFIGTTLTQWVD